MKKCAVESCSKNARSLNFCTHHYDRFRRYGDPLFVVKKVEPVLSEVFMKYVLKMDNGCWNWSGGTAKGYGKFRMKEKSVIASRASYLLFKNIPDNFKELLVCHHCDNPLCVNPDHLFLGTTQDNVTDKMQKGRYKAMTGTEQKTAKLDDEKVRFIRSRQMTGPELAEKFGVSLALIKAVRTGKRWKHVA